MRAVYSLAIRQQRSAADERAGHLGDVKPVRGDVSEMRVDIGPGYRLYFTIRERMVVFLLIGGDKSTQSADIRRAVRMSKEI